MKKHFLLASLVLLVSCTPKEETRKIQIFNKSNNIIYCFIGTTDKLTEPYIDYPESYLESYKINPDTFQYLYNKELKWETFIDRECNNGKLRLFIVSKDSVNKYSWEEVLENNIYSTVYKLDIEALNKQQWKITYDGK